MFIAVVHAQIECDELFLFRMNAMKFYSFALQLFVLAIPWSGYLYPAVVYNFRKRSALLPLIFFLAVLLFFSLSLNYKISRYILPLFPALAILIGKMISDADDDPGAAKWFKWSSLFTLPVILPLLVISTFILYFSFSKIGAYYAPLFLPFLAIMCFCLLVGGILGLVLKPKHSFMAYAGISIVAYLVLISCLTVYYPMLNPISAFCGKINRLAGPSDIVCQYKGTDAHFMIYYSDKDVIHLRSEKEMTKLLLLRKKVFCVSENEEAVGKLSRSLKGRMHITDKSANFTLFTN